VDASQACDNVRVGPVSCPDFVGRAAALGVLEDTLTSVAGNQPATVFISGEAGIGKSRLVREFCRRAGDDGAVVAMGFCTPSGAGGLPYAPVVGIWRSLASIAGQPRDLGMEDAAGDARLAKIRFFESVLDAVKMVSQDRLLVLVFEDLQWADSASGELVDFLTRNLSSTATLIIGTYRNDEIGNRHRLRSLLAELRHHHAVITLALARFDRAETEKMVGGILGYSPDKATVDTIHRRSEGNPFFAEELLATEDPARLPPALQDVIMSRVAELSTDSQGVLRVVAVAGSSIGHSLLLAASTLPAAPLDRAVAECVARGFLTVDSDGEGYRFRHGLQSEAIYRSLLPGERLGLHRQMAIALGKKPPNSGSASRQTALDLADHWWAAGEWAQALEASILAARESVAVAAYPEALPHLEHALAAWDLVLDPALCAGLDRPAVLAWAADTAYFAGAGARSVEWIHAAIDLVDAQADPVGAATYLTMLGRNAWAVGDTARAFAAYRQSRALLPADHPSVELARAWAEEAAGLMFTSRFEESAARCHDAITVARQVGARAEEGHALNTLGCCVALTGHPDEGIALVREALAIATELRRPGDLNRAYANLSELLMGWGRLDEAVAVISDAVADRRLGGIEPTCVLIGADSLVRLGRLDRAEGLLAGLGNLAGICGNSSPLAQVPIAIRRGRFAEAADHLRRADALTGELSDVSIRGRLHLLQAELALETNDAGDAWNKIEQAISLVAGTDDEHILPEACSFGARALADDLADAHARGRPANADKAVRLASDLIEEAERLLAAAVSRGARCPPRSLAFLASARAERSRLFRSDPDLWELAAEAWNVSSEPYPEAYCRWQEAGALLAGRASRARAAEGLTSAWRQCLAMGAAPLRAKIEDLSLRARIPLDQPAGHEQTSEQTVAGDLGLTPREVEVLGQLANGRSDRQIADTLFISKKTASVHVSNLLRKLDVANRVQAGEIGQRRGLG
jgi:DNA-binding CsgD family transcriptional regulator/tetratricopeptide (TPR) repeat protein